MFWSKPQALAEVQAGTVRLKTVLQSYVEACAEFDQANDSDLTKTAEDALAEGYLALTEEYCVSQCQNPDKKTKTNISTTVVGHRA